MRDAELKEPLPWGLHPLDWYVFWLVSLYGRDTAARLLGAEQTVADEHGG